MAVNGRNKGATFERKVAALFTEAFGYKFQRTPGSGAFATVHNDTRLRGDIYTSDVDRFPYVMELKKYKEYNFEDFLTGATSGIQKWLNQLIREKEETKGILIVQRDYGKIFCMVEGLAEKNIPNTFIYNEVWTVGLLDKLLPYIVKEVKDESL